MATAKQTPQSIFWPLATAAIILTGIGTWQGIPLGLLATTATATVCALEPPVVFTGPKNKQGTPTPQGGEANRARRYQTCRQTLLCLILPGKQWVPGHGIALTWLAAFPIATLATLAPIASFWPRWLIFLSPPLTAHCWLSITYSLRQTAGKEPQPAVTLKHARTTPKWALLATATLTLAATLTILNLVTLPWQPSLPQPILAYALAAATTTVLAVSHQTSKNQAVKEWQNTQQAATMWDNLWDGIHKNTPPIHTKHHTIGPYTIDEFATITPTTASDFITLSPKIAPLLGAGINAVALPTPATNPQGQPNPATPDPSRFRVVSWNQEPDLTNPNTNLNIIQLAIEAETGLACDQLAPGTRILTSQPAPIHPTTNTPNNSPDHWWWWRQLAGKNTTRPNNTPQNTNPISPGWCFTGYGIDENTLQTSLFPNITLSGMNLIYDTRYTHKGILANPNTITPDPDSEIYQETTSLKRGIYQNTDGFRQFWGNILEETTWRQRWGDIKEIGDVNPPTPQFHLQKQAELQRPYTPLTSLPFATRQGIPPSTFFKLENKIATVLGGAPFVSVTGFCPPGAKTGTRHPQGVTITWAHRPAPDTPAELPPSRDGDTTAQQWILAGQVNRAFDNLKLPRPELAAARPLTPTTATKHLWEIKLRLYDSVTIQDLRKNTGRLASALRCPWVRATQTGTDPSDATIVAGIHYRDTTIPDPEDLAMLQDLEWSAAWEACGVSAGGKLPQPVSAGFLETNQKIERLVFKLPPGLGLEDARRAEKKLGGATGNQFTQIRPDTTPGQIIVLACETDPMPFPAPLDYNQAVELPDPPFATGIEGAPVCWNPTTDPHLLVVGTTGGGKSTFVQTFLYPLLARGWEVVVIDPVKKAADFKCYQPWCAHVATGWGDVTATMKALKAEQDRRFDLYREANVQDIYHLPDGQRPPEILLVVDEFNSAVAVDKPGTPVSSDRDSLRNHAQLELAYTASRTLGVTVGQIAAQGRSAGIHVMLAGQRVTAKTLEQVKGGEVLRTNLGRVLLGKATYGEKQSALRDPDQAPDLGDYVPKGRGVFESVTGAAQVIQAWYPPDGDPLTVLAGHLEAYRPPGTALDLRVDEYRVPEAESFEGQIVENPGETVMDMGVIDLDLTLDELEGTVL